ncbi:flagellar assembly protein FliH [Geosporobacter subterraneus DSM 17957]|uniref:Flagellar assembly protein FliH n=1 Tax=Geosporobacter subterraneus DSM 17957 TaxID=1121919 RepID=A0A1M6E512_9FIRM|nr:FliH/SctL family protein [Geosporobacter subterraneus]SHI80459.1 flagellar assembly protein FliH [Geosporobacter subterraneus DSM 17957]
MSRIFKSPYIRVGEKKEIEANIPLEPVLEYEESHKDVEQKPSFDEIMQDKLQALEDEIQDRLRNAATEAEKIIQEAYENAKQIYQNAKIEGYEEGKKEGYEDGKSEADYLIQEALQIKEALQRSKREAAKDFEKELVDLVIETVEKILYERVEDSYETIIGLIKLGLEKCTYTDSLVIRVSPEDYAYAISARPKILSLAENIDDIQIKQDAAFKKGSCVIDTISGSIDSSIETQLNQIKELFKELLESE